MLAPNVINEIEKRALEIAAIFDAKDGKRYAEIVPGVRAEWGMIKVIPGKENKTANKLGDRGIGSFVPKFDAESVLEVERRTATGKKWIEKIDVGNKLIFPGRIFIFVWDLLGHWRRIKTCPGVQAIVLDGAERPVVVPDSEIDKIQVLQFCLYPKGKKKRKRYQSGNDGHLATMSTRSYWTVDGTERNQVLDRSLGLAS